MLGFYSQKSVVVFRMMDVRACLFYDIGQVNIISVLATA